MAQQARQLGPAKRFKGFILKIITANQLPYLIAVAFGAVGWGITHSVDRIVESPIVEVSEINRTLDDGNKRLELSIQNLSNNEVIREIELLLKFPNRDGHFFTNSLRMIPTAPAYVTQDTPDFLNRKNLDGMSQIFKIDMLHPGWKILFIADYSSNSDPIYQFRSAENAMRIMKPSLVTFFARNELILLWCGILVIIPVLFWILATIETKES